MKKRNPKKSIHVIGNDNHIVLFDDNGVEQKLTQPIQGLMLSVKGNGNIIRIHKDTVFKKSRISIENDEAEVSIDLCSLLSITVDISHGAAQRFCIGKGTRIGGAFFVLNEESSCVIGQNCLISSDVWFWCSDGHSIFDHETGVLLNRPVRAIQIHDRCWIGHACRILKGSSMGEDSVLGGGSVLAGQFSDTHVILAGNPAKIIRRGTSWSGQSGYSIVQQRIKNQMKEISSITPVFSNQAATVTVAFSSSNYYAAFLSVLLLSLVDHANAQTNYDLVILTADMSDENQSYLKKLIERKNVSLRFVNVSALFDKIQTYVPWYVGIETYFRILTPKLFDQYDKVLFMDSDTLILSDISDLYQIQLDENCPLAAAEELLFQAAFTEGRRNITDFLKTLGLSNPRRYFQAGVILFNCRYCNEHKFSEKLLDNIQKKQYEMVDQDALNELCADRFLLIGSEWNYPPVSEKSKKFLELMPPDVKAKHQSVLQPKIIHFIGAYWKPWCAVDNIYDYRWWNYARKTDYYEELLKRLCSYRSSSLCFSESVQTQINHILSYRKNRWHYICCKIMSKILFGRQRQKFKQKKRALKEVLRKTRRYLKEAA